MAAEKKIDQRFLLSDDSVNVYGFRCLSAGCVLSEFIKNPIGYFMHERDKGVVLRWDDVKLEGDKITGVPVINLANTRGDQTAQEIEAGFLNAASIGHIVVLEHSDAPELKLPGQIGPTLTKWYMRETSLVDIPGNTNSFKLSDASGNELNLSDFSTNLKLPNDMNGLTISIANLMAVDPATANLKDEASVIAYITNLKADAAKVPGLEKQLSDLKADSAKKDVEAILAKGLADKKLTKELSDKLSVDYATNPTGLKTLVDTMLVYQSIAQNLKSETGNIGEPNWKWDDFEKNDPSGKKLMTLRAENPAKYQELYDARFKNK